MSSKTVDLKPFTSIAIAIFALLALAHFLRVVFAWEVVIDGLTVPLGASVVVAFVAAGLAFMLWRESRG